MYKKLVKDDNGFTGLEAAIVLIAFVVVAAVFSYVMLGAGFFTTQKSQEVVHTGVTQASSSVALAGDVIMEGGDDGATPTPVGEANVLTFYLTNTAGGTPVDLDKTIITYTDKDDFATQGHLVTAGAESGAWHYAAVIPTTKATSANLIESGDKFKITLDLTTAPFTTGTAMGITTLPRANENIKIEVKPPEGAVLVITRIMPPSIGTGVFYPVY